jgi:hypothetical protein
MEAWKNCDCHYFYRKFEQKKKKRARRVWERKRLQSKELYGTHLTSKFLTLHQFLISLYFGDFWILKTRIIFKTFNKFEGVPNIHYFFFLTWCHNRRYNFKTYKNKIVLKISETKRQTVIVNYHLFLFIKTTVYSSYRRRLFRTCSDRYKNCHETCVMEIIDKCTTVHTLKFYCHTVISL